MNWGFSPSGIVVRLRYQAPAALEEAVAAVLQKVFQSRLDGWSSCASKWIGSRRKRTAGEEAERSEEGWEPLTSSSSIITRRIVSSRQRPEPIALIADFTRSNWFAWMFQSSANQG